MNMFSFAFAFKIGYTRIHVHDAKSTTKEYFALYIYLQFAPFFTMIIHAAPHAEARSNGRPSHFHGLLLEKPDLLSNLNQLVTRICFDEFITLQSDSRSYESKHLLLNVTNLLHLLCQFDEVLGTGLLVGHVGVDQLEPKWSCIWFHQSHLEEKD
jgi:hypothetical protein